MGKCGICGRERGDEDSLWSANKSICLSCGWILYRDFGPWAKVTWEEAKAAVARAILAGEHEDSQ